MTTQELSTRTPPHIRAPSNCRLTSQGQLPGGAGEPPTILERGCVIFWTTDDLWPHTATGTDRPWYIKKEPVPHYVDKRLKKQKAKHCAHVALTSLTEKAGKLLHIKALIFLCEHMYLLTLCMCLRSWFQALHCVKQAALEDAGATTLTHDPDAALLLHFPRWTAMLVVCTGLAQSPTPLCFILKLLGFTDDITARLWQGTGRRCCWARKNDMGDKEIQRCSW